MPLVLNTLGWDKDIFPNLLTVDETPTNLTPLSHEMEDITEIKRLESTDSLKTLGVMTLPSGSMNAQFQRTSEELKGIMILVKAAHLSRREASLILPVYIHFKLRYLPSSTAFTKKQCHKLDQIFRSTIISKICFNQKTKLEIIHSSHGFAGMQIPA